MGDGARSLPFLGNGVGRSGLVPGRGERGVSWNLDIFLSPLLLVFCSSPLQLQAFGFAASFLFVLCFSLEISIPFPASDTLTVQSSTKPLSESRAPELTNRSSQFQLSPFV